MIKEALESPLTQGRGLKHSIRVERERGNRVAPHAGAWIETSKVVHDRLVHLSPLTQGRGLKQQAIMWANAAIASPLTQGRGLKRRPAVPCASPPGVAPHAGAWIETSSEWPGGRHPGVAPHAGAWIETAFGRQSGNATARRPSRRGVD